jgi:hypothetical protein
MSVTIVLVGLVVFAFFAGHLINRYAARYIPVSGAEYLVIGALIGPQIPPRVLTQDALAQITPLVSLLLGLSGFLVGLQAVRKSHALRLVLTGIAVALSTLLCLSVVFAIGYGLLTSSAAPPLVQRSLFSAFGYHFELFATAEQCAVGLVLAAAGTVTFSSSFSGDEAERLSGVPA